MLPLQEHAKDSENTLVHLPQRSWSPSLELPNREKGSLDWNPLKIPAKNIMVSALPLSGTFKSNSSFGLISPSNVTSMSQKIHIV